jgi:DNA-binding response OmpR family regulator
MPSGSATPRVLVVDDDQRLADSLAVILNRNGFSTIAAYSGREAVEAALKSPPDFILMDVMMNGIDGVDAAIAICEIIPQTRILLMSGAEEAIQRLEKGSCRGHFFELMMKPLAPASLLDKLRH